MRSDPRTGYWVSLSVAAIAVAWLGLFALDGDALHDRLGSAAFAITFIALFLAISAVIVAMLFRRFVRVRNDLVAGSDVVARWTVDPEDWPAFAEHAGEATRADHRAILVAILAFDVVICSVLAAINPGDATIFLWIGLGIAAVGCLGWLLGRRAMADHLTFRTGDVIVGRRGMLVNGVLHVWGYAGARLDAVQVIDDEKPNRLAFTYSWIARTGRQYATAYAPIPDGCSIGADILARIRPESNFSNGSRVTPSAIDRPG